LIIGLYGKLRFMKLIRMTGGLGNQMFIYGFYITMKKYFPDIKLDISEMKNYNLHNGYELEKVFNIQFDKFVTLKWVKKLIVWLFFRKIKENRKQTFSLDFYTNNSNYPFIYYTGYFQSEKFFINDEDKIRKCFVFDESKLNQRSKLCLDKLDKLNNTVSIHICRGDYLNKKNNLIFGNICTVDYYQKALSKVEERIITPVYYVFSNDMDWVNN